MKTDDERSGRQPEILVVDDNLQNLKLLEEVLVKTGYRVRLARDGELALNSAVLQQPSLILLDIRMPGIDGFEVCRRLKADERTSSVPVIFISILEDERDKVKAFLAGGVDYITKPFQPEEILARIQTHIRLRELTECLEQEVRSQTEELTRSNQKLQEEITERKQAAGEIRQLMAQQKALLEVYQTMASVPLKEIISFLVDQCVKLTGSALGFVGLISDDDQKMEAQIWSEKAMAHCPINKPLDFSIPEAGLWAEPIRQRRVVVVNEYSAPNPHKKGLPEGHLELTRFLGVPVVDRDRVVAVAGVANRQEAYTEADQAKISLLLEGMWDLIKRQRAEEELRRERTFVSRIMETSPVGITLVSREGLVTFANQRAELLLGLKQEELDQRTYNAPQWRITDFDGNPFPDEELPFSRVMATGQPVFDVRHAITWPDGKRIFLSINGAPLLAESGEIESVVFVLEDVTERQATEEALRRNEKALRIRETLLNESQRVGLVGGWDWDALSDTIWWSDEYYRIYGLEVGSPPPGYEEHLKVYTPESAARLDEAVKRAMELGESYEVDLELAKPTPITRWIVARCEVKRDEAGAICGLRGTAQNISERKKAEEQLRKLNEELEERVQERTAELKGKNMELERMNKLFIGRELKMVELKKRIKEQEEKLEGRSGQ
ncbi:MAG: response regulator [Proteobacteria bacterium]|nr:response regulator [Pseudomonadota bacterium]MBU1715282.1 response regulator [Pseudomonadota bacterium]